MDPDAKRNSDGFYCRIAKKSVFTGKITSLELTGNHFVLATNV